MKSDVVHIRQSYQREIGHKILISLASRIGQISPANLGHGGTGEGQSRLSFFGRSDRASALSSRSLRFGLDSPDHIVSHVAGSETQTSYYHPEWK